jgi:hypothetical protein
LKYVEGDDEEELEQALIDMFTEQGDIKTDSA